MIALIDILDIHHCEVIRSNLKGSRQSIVTFHITGDGGHRTVWAHSLSFTVIRKFRTGIFRENIESKSAVSKYTFKFLTNHMGFRWVGCLKYSGLLLYIDIIFWRFTTRALVFLAHLYLVSTLPYWVTCKTILLRKLIDYMRKWTWFCVTSEIEIVKKKCESRQESCITNKLTQYPNQINVENKLVLSISAELWYKNSILGLQNGCLTNM